MSRLVFLFCFHFGSFETGDWNGPKPNPGPDVTMCRPRREGKSSCARSAVRGTSSTEGICETGIGGRPISFRRKCNTSFHFFCSLLCVPSSSLITTLTKWLDLRLPNVSSHISSEVRGEPVVQSRIGISFGVPVPNPSLADDLFA